MQIGSIVICIEVSAWKMYPEVKIPAVGKRYVVRGFFDNATLSMVDRILNDKTSVYLEEIKNEAVKLGPFIMHEPSFNQRIFKELLPPVDILKMIEEEIEELA